MDKQELNQEDTSDFLKETHLTKDEMDTLGEMGNISIGTSATTLYSLLGNKVAITTPTVNITTVDRLGEKYPIPFVIVEIKYTKGLNGSNLMIIQEKDAKVIADLMMGGDGKNIDVELDELRLSAVEEAMNQMMGSSATSLSTMLNKDINISPPELHTANLAQERKIGVFSGDEKIVQVSFKMKIGDFLESELMQLMPISFAKDVVAELQSFMQNGDGEVAVESPGLDTTIDETLEADTPTVNYYGQLDDLRPKVSRLKEEAKTQIKEKPPEIEVSPVTFESFDTASDPVDSSNLDIIMDVPLEVTVELGRTSKTIKDVLDLNSGAIIELNKMAGEPVDILVNGKFVAKGEVVVIDENFGVRITDILTTLGKISSLQ